MEYDYRARGRANSWGAGHAVRAADLPLDATQPLEGSSSSFPEGGTAAEQDACTPTPEARSCQGVGVSGPINGEDAARRV